MPRCLSCQVRTKEAGCRRCDVTLCATEVCQKAHRSTCEKVFITHGPEEDERLPVEFQSELHHYRRVSEYRPSAEQQSREVIIEKGYINAIEYRQIKVLTNQTSFSESVGIHRYSADSVPLLIRQEAERYIAAHRRFFLLIIQGNYKPGKNATVYSWHFFPSRSS